MDIRSESPSIMATSSDDASTDDGTRVATSSTPSLALPAAHAHGQQMSVPDTIAEHALPFSEVSEPRKSRTVTLNIGRYAI
jgi:hypothetical protein